MNFTTLAGQALCLYSNDKEPIGFIYLLHDLGLEHVDCFGKKATIAMFVDSRQSAFMIIKKTPFMLGFPA